MAPPVLPLVWQPLFRRIIWVKLLMHVLLLLANDIISDEELFAIIPAPDFPTGGIICGRAGIVKAYKTGRGNLILRGVVEIEETKKGTSIIITELPYHG